MLILGKLAQSVMVWYRDYLPQDSASPVVLLTQNLTGWGQKSAFLTSIAGDTHAP